MIIYGINAVHEALDSEVKVKRVYVADRMDSRIRAIIESAKEKDVKVVRKDKEFFRDIKAKAVQYVAAEVDLKPVPFEELFEAGSEVPGIYLVLDQVEDPRNLGAIIRSAAASGVSGIVIQSRRSCGLTSAVFSASAGAVAHVRVSEVPNIKNAIRVFKDEDYQIIGTDSSGTQPCWEVDYTVNTVFVMGSEGKGLRKTVRELCDIVVKIPMDIRVSSINVSVATGVLLYEVLRQKNLEKPAR
ncbi:MAG: 23S rRNA (guanosine(2251)-2'-O)-methyltransferase RlmB [Thermodesulfovibrionales bacterium]